MCAVITDHAHGVGKHTTANLHSGKWSNSRQTVVGSNKVTVVVAYYDASLSFKAAVATIFGSACSAAQVRFKRGLLTSILVGT